MNMDVTIKTYLDKFCNIPNLHYICKTKTVRITNMKYERKIPIDLTCGVTIYQLMVGGKWKPYLINCINQGLKRPSEFLKVIPGATKRVLAQQLNEMEQMGLVTKKLYPETPPRAEYELTETGTSLIQLIRMMDEWDLKHSCLFNEKGQYIGKGIHA